MKQIIFIGIGILVVIVSLVWGILNFQFINKAGKVQGEVVRLNSGGSHPEIKFTTQDGKDFEYPQNGLIFGYKEGDKVEVLYDTQNPKNASINSFGALWGFPILVLTLGFIFVIVGVFQ